jgi:hypothetical protein
MQVLQCPGHVKVASVSRLLGSGHHFTNSCSVSISTYGPIGPVGTGIAGVRIQAMISFPFTGDQSVAELLLAVRMVRVGTSPVKRVKVRASIACSSTFARSARAHEKSAP